MTKTFCLGQNILSTAKKFISATCKSLKITLPNEKVHFYSKEGIFMDSCTIEINFLSMDKIFCPGRIIFVTHNICLHETKFISQCFFIFHKTFEKAQNVQGGIKCFGYLASIFHRTFVVVLRAHTVPCSETRHLPTLKKQVFL